jgi:hypothetical protein
VSPQLPFQFDLRHPPLLTLDHTDCGFLRDVKLGADGATLDLAFGQLIDRRVVEWINLAWNGTAEPKNGKVRASGAKTAIVFDKALITRTTLPALDAAAARIHPQFQLRLKAASVQTVAPGGGVASPPALASQNPWRASDFRVTIDHVDCDRVSAIAPFRVASDPGQAFGVSFPRLQMTFGGVDPISWQQWLEAKGEAALRNGALTYLHADLKSEWGSVLLDGLRLLNLAALPGKHAGDQIARTVATISSTQMKLEIKRPPWNIHDPQGPPPP